MTHLIDDETVAKMGHPVVVVWSDVGHPSFAVRIRSSIDSARAVCFFHTANDFLFLGRAP